MLVFMIIIDDIAIAFLKQSAFSENREILRFKCRNLTNLDIFFIFIGKIFSLKNTSIIFLPMIGSNSNTQHPSLRDFVTLAMIMSCAFLLQSIFFLQMAIYGIGSDALFQCFFCFFCCLTARLEWSRMYVELDQKSEAIH